MRIHADPDAQHYLKRRHQRAFNLRNWRTSVYSTAYYICFSSSAADWYVRVREEEHANEPRGPEEVDPRYLGKAFDTGIRYLLEKKFACYVCPVYSIILRVLTEKPSFLNMKNVQIVILF
jgi:hypothetical protein